MPNEINTVTRERAARLVKFLKLLSGTPKSRAALMGKLKTDQRAFYRDLRFLRSSGIEVSATGDVYILDDALEIARSKLPCPDPGLTLAEAVTLSRGSSEGHRKLKRMIASIQGDGAR